MKSKARTWAFIKECCHLVDIWSHFKNKCLTGQLWLAPLIPASTWEEEEEAGHLCVRGQLSPQSEFQDSQGCHTEKLCLGEKEEKVYGLQGVKEERAMNFEIKLFQPRYFSLNCRALLCNYVRLQITS